MASASCQGRVWPLKAHRFEPRYDKSPADLSMFERMRSTGRVVLMMAEKSRQVTYVGDVCRYCGLRVSREE